MKWIPPFGAQSANERYRNAEPTVAGSNPSAAFFNTVLDELLAIIVAAGMTPDGTTNSQISQAIVSLTERAATSGVTKGSFWFGKTKADTVVPSPTLAGQNYMDFITLETFECLDGSTWTKTGTFVPPEGIDFTILITSKFWDIPEQDGQQGGEAKYNHTDGVWAYWPQIISLKDAALTGTPTTPTLSQSSPGAMVVNKQSMHNFQGGQDILETNSTIALADDKTIYVVDATSLNTLTVSLNTGSISVPANSAKTFEVHIRVGTTVPTVNWNTVDSWLSDSVTRPVDANKTAIFAIRIQNIDGTTQIIANYGGAY